jgi:hypothetical protein
MAGLPAQARATAGWRRATRAWRALAREQRLAAGAALALLGAMALPWYSVTFSKVVERKLETDTVPKSALFVFSWVEAAVLLVSVGALALLFARAERRPFHLPGGDGVVLAAAGAWASLLIAWRFFDKPDLAQGVVGIAWGIWVALAAALTLAYAGMRLRAAHRPEPPLPARAAADPPAREVLPDERPHLDETAVLERDPREGPPAPPGG